MTIATIESISRTVVRDNRRARMIGKPISWVMLPLMFIVDLFTGDM